MPERLRQIRLPTSKGVDSGIRCLDTDNYPGAIECLVKAIKADPQDGVAHAWLGVTYARLGQFTDARYELRIARDLGETSISRIGAGEIFLKLGEPAKALKEFSQAGVNQPTAAAYDGMARASAQLNDPPQVLYAYRKAIPLAGSEREQANLRMAAADYCLSEQDYPGARQFLGPRVYLGAEYSPVKTGIRVSRVKPGWPASASGLKEGDILVNLAGSSLAGASMSRFSGILNGLKPGPVAKAQILRDGQTLNVDLQTDLNPAAAAPALPPDASSTPATNRPSTWAQPIAVEGFPNLHKVSDSVYRSAQPDEGAYPRLKPLGIKVVLSLRSFHGEGEDVAAAGLEYEHLYVKSWHPEEKEVYHFLRLATDPARTPILVHCQHGADRTGIMIALYRIIIQNWTRDEAIREMTTGGYGFHSVWQNLVTYVRDFDVDAMRANLAKAVPPGPAGF